MDPLFSQGFARDPQSIGNKNLKNLALFRNLEGSGDNVLLHRFHGGHQICREQGLVVFIQGIAHTLVLQAKGLNAADKVALKLPSTTLRITS
jgi:hypothetical protein